MNLGSYRKRLGIVVACLIACTLPGCGSGGGQNSATASLCAPLQELRDWHAMKRDALTSSALNPPITDVDGAIELAKLRIEAAEKITNTYDTVLAAQESNRFSGSVIHGTLTNLLNDYQEILAHLLEMKESGQVYPFVPPMELPHRPGVEKFIATVEQECGFPPPLIHANTGDWS